MKIGIDISQIVYGTGVSFYTQSLVENLLKIDNKNEYRLFFSSLRKNLPASFKYKTANARLKSFKIPPTLLEPLFNKSHLLPIESFIGKVDVFHSSDWTQPPTRAKKVTTIHDFGFLKYPETAHPKIKAVMERRFRWIKKEIDMVIAISQSTKKDTMEILGIPENKIKVVYEAVPEDITQVKNKQTINKIKNKYHIKGDYILSVATLEPRKNLKIIIQAFQALGIKDLQLVIIGKSGWDNIRMDNGIENVKFTGYVNRQDLAALYSGAVCLAFPSLYEGFGLPILEAMQCGCPVITSHLSSMPEVAGKAGILVDPMDIEEIGKGFYEVVSNKIKRQEMIKEGFKQVKKFSWEKTARQTLKVYEDVVKQ